MRALLDTHVLVYWLDDGARLTDAQQTVIAAASEAHPLWVSDISIWEVGTLVGLGRLQLRLPLRDWLEAAVAPPLVRRVSISPTVVSEMAQLPSSFHRDPADRLIVASARATGATLLTHDPNIIGAGIVPTL